MNQYTLSFYKILFLIAKMRSSSKKTGFELIEDYQKEAKISLLPISKKEKSAIHDYLADFYTATYSDSIKLSDELIVQELALLVDEGRLKLINQISIDKDSVYVEGDNQDWSHLFCAVKFAMQNKSVYLKLEDHEMVDPLPMLLCNHFGINSYNHGKASLNCDTSIVIGDYETFNKLSQFKHLYLIAKEVNFVRAGTYAIARKNLFLVEDKVAYSLASSVTASDDYQMILVDYKKNECVMFNQAQVDSNSLFLSKDVNFSVDYHEKVTSFQDWIDSIKNNPKGYSTLGKLAPFRKTSQAIVDTKGEIAIIELSHNDFDQFNQIQEPQKIKMVSREVALDLSHRFSLKQGDLMISTKGGLGNVVMLDEALPDNCLPAMSMLAMRPTKESLTVLDQESNEAVELPTYYLYQYLRSEKVKSYLQSLNSGSGFTMIRLSDLKELPVPHIGKEEAKRLLEQQAIKKDKVTQIIQLMKEIEQL